MTVLAIDTGPTHSAYVVIDKDRHPLWFQKLENPALLISLRRSALLDGFNNPTDVAIEMVASYGMAVGADVFETCVWIGRFYQAITDRTGHEPDLITRDLVKLHHCHARNAKDTNIRQALIDRFAFGARNHGKGTKAQPGWFYGFHSDIWQAYALAVYTADMIGGRLEAVTP